MRHNIDMLIKCSHCQRNTTRKTAGLCLSCAGKVARGRIRIERPLPPPKPPKPPKPRSEYRRRSDGERLKNRLKKYGIDESLYTSLLQSQGGLCATCPADLSTVKVCIDHDHITGKVRGLLCSHCNSALGFAKDSISTLERMIKYLLGQL